MFVVLRSNDSNDEINGIQIFSIIMSIYAIADKLINEKMFIEQSGANKKCLLNYVVKMKNSQ